MATDNNIYGQQRVVIITDNYQKLADAQFTNLAFHHVIHAVCILVRPRRSLPIVTYCVSDYTDSHSP